MSAWDSSDDETDRLLKQNNSNYQTVEHNERLEELGRAIKRQKNLVNDIAVEVDLHNEILDDIDTGITNNTANLIKVTRNVNLVTKKTSTLYLWFIIVLLATIIFGIQVLADCDRVFSAKNSDSKQINTFEAPMRQLKNNSTQDYRLIHCILRFVADEEGRVVLNFSTFRLRGDEPECSREYVDIYITLKSNDNYADIIATEPPSGRFCTTVMPRRMVSLHNMILLIVYSEFGPTLNQKPIFTGSYEFIKPKSYDEIGSLEPGSLCEHSFYSSKRKEGEFQSVTYPGVYPKGLRCKYQFIGEPGQRIRLEFLDLDVYFGGTHCPLDSIKIYDGLKETDPLINTICGSHRSLIIFSTKETLLITFTTLHREIEVQNRGFSAYFEFSDKFFETSFIKGPNAKHIRGSECDQRIMSSKGTTGGIVSPDSKNHSNAICRYFFEGLQTSHDYEKVLLKFTEFDLKSARSTIGTSSASSNSTLNQSNSSIFGQSSLVDPNPSGAANQSVEQCTDGYVRIYTSEQKPDQKQDPNDYDYVYCGNDIPQLIESDAATLLVEYNSGSTGGYFKAEYSFIVDFRIPGLQSASDCNYTYKSDYLKTGIFNSPRYPSWYINEMACSYFFMTKNDEVLLLQFNSFKMANSFNEKVVGSGEACKGEDSVEIYELTLDSSEQRVIDQVEIGTYCGTTTPGPLLSYKPVRINFKTNREQVHYGFSAVYNFYPTGALKTNEFVTNCGGNIHTSQKLRSGSFSSPETYRSETYEKRNHICSWNITARQNHRIALNFNRFELEGSPLVRGCMTASVRLQTGKSKVPTEICGTTSPWNSSSHQFISDGEWISVTFISTKQASGSNGFSITWMEIKRP